MRDNVDQYMTHNENIKTFDYLLRHLELEAKCLESSKATKAVKSGSAYVANNDSRAPKESKCKNYPSRQDSINGPTLKKAKNTKCKRGNCGGKGINDKCFNCNKEGQFARYCTKPRKVLPNFNSPKFFVSTHIMVAYSYPYWIVDSRVTEHVAIERIRFLE